MEFPVLHEILPPVFAQDAAPESVVGIDGKDFPPPGKTPEIEFVDDGRDSGERVRHGGEFAHALVVEALHFAAECLFPFGDVVDAIGVEPVQGGIFVKKLLPPGAEAGGNVDLVSVFAEIRGDQFECYISYESDLGHGSIAFDDPVLFFSGIL